MNVFIYVIIAVVVIILLSAALKVVRSMKEGAFSDWVDSWALEDRAWSDYTFH